MEQKPQIPTLKDSKRPQVKIKGLASTLTFVERLKQFKKKDLAFILAGLGVLFMAPLAEHFLMSPENADSGSFKPGWGFQASGRFGDGSSPYEGGVGGLAPGGVAGGGTDVITPLNVRDPSALVMGPGAQQQPAATATTTPPAAKEPTDWKDAIANAAAKGASAATKSASLPVPKTSITSSLRGLGAVSGGGGGSYSLPPISAGNVPNRAAGSNSLQSVSAPGFHGVARGPQNASGAAMEALKAAAAAAGKDFNRTGSADALGNAAAQAMPSGNAGFGGGQGEGGSGGADKGAGGNQDKGSKNVGESLEFIAQKDWQSKMRELKYDLLKKQQEFWPDLMRDVMKEGIMTPWKKITEEAGKYAADITKGKGDQWKCYAFYSAKADQPISDDDVAKFCGSQGGDSKDKVKKYCRYACPSDYKYGEDCLWANNANTTQPTELMGANCQKGGGDKSSPGPTGDPSALTTGIGVSAEAQANLDSIEKDMKQEVTTQSGMESKVIGQWDSMRRNMGSAANILREVSQRAQDISQLLHQAADEVVGQDKVIAQARATLDGAKGLQLVANATDGPDMPEVYTPTAPHAPAGKAGEVVELVSWKSWMDPYLRYSDSYSQVGQHGYLSQAEGKLGELGARLGTVDTALGVAGGIKEDKALKNSPDASKYDALAAYAKADKELQKKLAGHLATLKQDINTDLASTNKQIEELHGQIAWVNQALCPHKDQCQSPPSMTLPGYNLCKNVARCDPAAAKTEKLKQLKQAWTDVLKPVGASGLFSTSGLYQNLNTVEQSISGEVKGLSETDKLWPKVGAGPKN